MLPQSGDEQSAIPEHSESSSLINIIYIVCLRITLYTCTYVYVQVLTSLYFILELLDYALSLSMFDSVLELYPHQLSHNRNLVLII